MRAPNSKKPAETVETKRLTTLDAAQRRLRDRAVRVHRVAAGREAIYSIIRPIAILGIHTLTGRAIVLNGSDDPAMRKPSLPLSCVLQPEIHSGTPIRKDRRMSHVCVCGIMSLGWARLGLNTPALARVPDRQL